MVKDIPKTNITQASNSKKIVSKALFTLLSFVSLFVIIFCTWNAAQRINKPFSGFFVNWRVMAMSLGQNDWPGNQAGLRYPDKILEIDGARISSIYEFQKIIKEKPVGEQLEYTVERNGDIFKVTIPTLVFTWFDFWVTYGPFLLPALFYIFIGIIVYILKPDTQASWSFFLTCAFFSVLNATGPIVEPLIICKLNVLSMAFCSSAVYHMSFVFPEKKAFIDRYPYVKYVPYGISAAVGFPAAFLYPEPPFFTFYAIANVLTSISPLAIIVSTAWSYFKKTSTIARQRAKVIFLGAALGLPIPALLRYLTLYVNDPDKTFILANFINLPLMIFPASIAFAIAKHNLFDVDVYIKRTVGYVIMTGVVGSVYFVIQLAVKSVVLAPVLGSYAENVYPIIFAILVVFFFNPLNMFVQGIIEKLFFRKKFDYKDTILSASNALTSVLNLDEVIYRVIQTVRKEMFLDTAGLILVGAGEEGSRGIFIRDIENKKEEQVEMQFTADDPLVKLISREKKLITRYDVEEDQRYKNICQQCNKSFEETGSSLLIPLTYQDEVKGVLTLGYKKSGRFYTRDDIDLLETLTNQSAIAIENARLFEENIEKTRMEEELKIAHDIQISMLPEHSPEIKGYSIAASSYPAREVGGDFYDFIEIGEGSDKKLGIIVGDVSGKAVSGALVMAASRSIFRVLADPDVSVSDMMLKGNRRLKHDVKKGMFVALVYALLDPPDRTMTIVNAGQTQPIICSNQGDKPSYIDSEGDRFPLGIIEDCDYQETVVTLKPGDTVVLYTDGIVEAMNEAGDMYGFDRFIDVIDTNRELGADAFLRTLMSDVTHFVGDAEQHDDLTIVAVKVE